MCFITDKLPGKERTGEEHVGVIIDLRHLKQCMDLIWMSTEINCIKSNETIRKI